MTSRCCSWPDEHSLDEYDDQGHDEEDVGKVEDEGVHGRHGAVLLHPPAIVTGIFAELGVVVRALLIRRVDQVVGKLVGAVIFHAEVAVQGSPVDDSGRRHDETWKK